MKKIIPVLGLLFLTTFQAHACPPVLELPLSDVLSSLAPESRSIVEQDMARAGISAAQAPNIQIQISGDSVAVNDPSQSTTPNQLFYLGLRFGYFYVLGLEARAMLLDSQGRPHYDIDAEANTNVFWDTLNLGFGVHPNHNALYVGGRIQSMTNVGFLDSDVQHYLGIGPEVGATFLLGDTKRFMVDLGLGAPVLFNLGNPGQSLVETMQPDFRAGVSIRVGR